MAAIHTNTRLTNLFLSLSSTYKLGSLLTHQRSSLLSCTSSLRRFAFFNDDDKFNHLHFRSIAMSLLSDILKHAPYLEHLWLDLGVFAPLVDGNTTTRASDLALPQQIAESFLLANRSKHLASLNLHHAVVSQSVLLEALSKRGPWLKVLELKCIRLLDAPQGWSTVLRKIFKFRGLQHLQLHDLSIGSLPWVKGESSLVLDSTKRGLKVYEDLGMINIEFGYREEVISGLTELLSKPLTYKTYR